MIKVKYNFSLSNYINHYEFLDKIMERSKICYKKPSKQTSSIMDLIEKYPTTLVEVNIIQSILTSKLPSMDKSTIEMVLNTLVHYIKNVLDKSFNDINCLAYRIDTLMNDFFTYDYIQHRLVFIGNGFERHLPFLKEKLLAFVKSKMGDSFSLIIRDEQDSDEVYFWS
jgi:hypothetical protein